MTQIDKANHFHALHNAETPLVLYNIWDVASAKTVADAGASALATGSWSLAAAQGFADGQIIPLSRVVTIVADIVAQTHLPVSLDFECGYADDIEGLTQNFEHIIETGVVGVNFEDQVLNGQGLTPLKQQIDRIVALTQTAQGAGVPMFINARTDTFLQTEATLHASRVAEAIDRGRAYAEAGASGFFVPGLTDEALIAQICEAVSLPVNIMSGGSRVDLTRLSNLGVSRVSFGPNPFRDLMAKFEKMASQLYLT